MCNAEVALSAILQAVNMTKDIVVHTFCTCRSHSLAQLSQPDIMQRVSTADLSRRPGPWNWQYGDGKFPTVIICH